MLKKVLIVEDYEDCREFMKMLIEAFGYEALLAANGSEAVEMVSKEVPDLVLMDMSMPVMDGLTATEIIRSSVSIARMPIVALTAHGNAIHNEAMKAGCNEVIGKPLDFDSLIFVLNQYLQDI